MEDAALAAREVAMPDVMGELDAIYAELVGTRTTYTR